MAKKVAKKSSSKKVASKKVAKKSSGKKSDSKASSKKISSKKAVTDFGPLKIGKKAPSFRLKNESNEWVSLADLRGKTVVIYFYPKDFTPGCTQESCDFGAAWGKFKKLDTVILGVSRDSVESHLKFQAKHNLPFSLLSDESGNMCEAYGVWKEKSLYGRKFMGIVRTTVILDADGKVMHVDPKVSVKGHVDQVLDVVRGS